MRSALFLSAALLAAACRPETPSDDPADWPVDTGVAWEPVLGEPQWVIPSRALPAEARPVLPSNNNVDLARFEDRLFLGWRTAETHFASKNTRLHVVSSPDLGQTWRYETTVSMEADLREPLFLAYRGVLRFHWFEAGVDPFSFEPKRQWRIERRGDGTWTAPEPWGEEKEITWSLEVRGGVAYRTAYLGDHYRLDGSLPAIEVRFTKSTDGRAWTPVGGDGVVYVGGVSESAFELDAQGNLWAVTRNEDGDATGFGSHVCFAPKAALSAWECSAKSDPERYDSPKLFRHGDDVFLVARRDVGGPFDLGLDNLSFKDQQTQYLLAYSARPKRTALYRLDRDARKVVWLFDLPSSGDTAFPSVVRLDAHRFLVANYTSPLDSDVDRSWWRGQNLPEGTRIYLVPLEFRPK